MTDIQDFLSKFKPFSDDGLSFSMSDLLTIENASDKVSVRHKDRIDDITQDKAGLAQAKDLVRQTDGQHDPASQVISAVAKACLSFLERNAKMIPDQIQIRPTIELPGDPFGG